MFSIYSISFFNNTLTAAFGNSNRVTGGLYFIYRFKIRSSEGLVLLGFSINALFGALTTLMVNISVPKPESRTALLWLMGSFQASSNEQFFPFQSFLFITCLFFSSKLDLLSLQEVSKSYGVSSVEKELLKGVLILSLLIGVSVQYRWPYWLYWVN